VVDGLYDDDGYRREKRSLEDKLANLVVPGVDAAMEAGKLLEDLPVLWEEADLTERRKLLMAMLDAVYVDTVEEKSVVAIRPKPAFRPIFEVATTRGGSGIVLINETPPDPKAQRQNHYVLGGDGGRSKRPATNFPGFSLDTNRFDCLVEKSGLGVEPGREPTLTKASHRLPTMTC